MLLIRISDGVEQEVAVPNPIVLTKQENGALRKWSGPPTDNNLLQSWAYRHGYEVPEQIEEATTTVKSYTKHSKGKAIRVKQYVRVLHGTKQNDLDRIVVQGILPGEVTKYKNWDYVAADKYEKDVFVSLKKDLAIRFGKAASHDQPFAVIEAMVPADLLKVDHRIEGGMLKLAPDKNPARKLREVKPEWIKKIHYYAVGGKAMEEPRKSFSSMSKGELDKYQQYKELRGRVLHDRTVVVNEQVKKFVRVYIPAPTDSPLIPPLQEVTRRLLPFKLLQERKTKVRAHKSKSKRGKVYNVRQYDRNLRDEMQPKSVRVINKRAWRNKSAFIPIKYRLTDQESGALGENLVIASLKARGWKKAKALNMEKPNAPFDAVYDHTLVEIKTGNAYNKIDAMKWSINFGGMSKKEKKMVRKMTPKQKKGYYKERFRKILKAKQKVMDKYEFKYGRRFKVETVGVILNTRKKRADIYHTPGIHKQLRWRNVPNNYVHTVEYSL